MVDIHKGQTKHCDDFMECELVGVILDVVILKNQYGVKFADGQRSHLKPMEIQLHTSLLQRYLNSLTFALSLFSRHLLEAYGKFPESKMIIR